MLDEVHAGISAIEKGAIVGTQVGAGTSLFGFFTLNQWLAIGGFLLAVASFVFQVCCTLYFKSRHLKLAEARLAADLAASNDDDD